jgi:hypothetical protein
VPSYPWYEIVPADDGLQQGDIIRDCPVIQPPRGVDLFAGLSTEPIVFLYDVVILSQSCDLVNGKLDIVLVSPIIPIEEFRQSHPDLRNPRMLDRVRQGDLPGYHMLRECDLEGHPFPHQIVDFRSVYGVDFEFLSDFAIRRVPRVRLLPPYREHLSQAFARFFMRVGLPVDIPAFH